MRIGLTIIVKVKVLGVKKGAIFEEKYFKNIKQVPLFTVLIYMLCRRQISGLDIQYEPRYEKTGFLYMRKQRRRSASR